MGKRKLRQNEVGLTGQVIMFPDMSPDTSPILSPVKRQTRIVTKPAPIAAVHRVCAFCGAEFEDYSQRPNTLYCKDSHKVSMSELKRARAIVALAAAGGTTEAIATDVIESTGLRAVEKALNQLGYSWVGKEWVK